METATGTTPIKPRPWEWPTDEEMDAKSLSDQKRDYLIMASECGNRAGPMGDEGQQPRPEWITKRGWYRDEAKRCERLMASSPLFDDPHAVRDMLRDYQNQHNDRRAASGLQRPGAAIQAVVGASGLSDEMREQMGLGPDRSSEPLPPRADPHT